MANTRKQTEDFIIDYIDKIAPGGENKKIYSDMFSKMNDQKFHEFMLNLKNKVTRLAIIKPNFPEVRIKLEDLFKVGDSLGYNFFKRIWVPAQGGNRAYLTPIPYLVVDLPLRRQAQLLSKKISIPKDNNTVDDFTGQPTGDSKGSKVSYPEAQVLMAMGLKTSLTELLKYRGGDEKGFNAMNNSIDKTGTVNLAEIERYTSGVTSIHTLKALLNAMMLKNTLEG